MGDEVPFDQIHRRSMLAPRRTASEPCIIVGTSYGVLLTETSLANLSLQRVPLGILEIEKVLGCVQPMVQPRTRSIRRSYRGRWSGSGLIGCCT
jgi:hypothetical protein